MIYVKVKHFFWQTLTAYLKFMVDTVVLLGGHQNETAEEMRKVLLFEQEIANVR